MAKVQRTPFRRTPAPDREPPAETVHVATPAESFSPPEVTGAPGAVFILGGGLAAVALWHDVLHPIVNSAWGGQKLAITLPPGRIVGLLAFVGLLVFLSDLSSDFASLALYLVVALWAVYLIMNPTTVTNVVGIFTGQSAAASAPPSNAANPPAPRPANGGPF